MNLKIGQTIKYLVEKSVYEGTIIDLWPGGVTLSEPGSPWAIQIQPIQVEEIVSGKQQTPSEDGQAQTTRME